ncbi:hypothetical protein CONCODRAFT_170552 [Conidiobolus coronatus NRRL 28638]|uniref:Arrestin C-terminal-like domain-containing protein n=1 Tax=Conidiobolus coronatus (strain ATCC 28846 / CBS 209.66 / NRRL 28638) TaxID=796925 RepID=A0A137PH36_CONC2|nr:hypothetical protein CONCODRAFT_170552 [Conidiobolus coronatus NRRL 28638]|eukprot:KXN74313.1 hypothetical protein CONCODRAFT_170552 [Conidiobolus coronatus NRRL 28638]
MFKDLKQIVNLITINNDIKARISLLSGDTITVPDISEEFDKFSIQGNLIIDSLTPKRIKSITIQFNGNLHNTKDGSFENQKSSIIDNQLRLVSEPVDVSVGCSVFGFELALPNTLPSSINSKTLKLKYTLTAHIEFIDYSKLTKKHALTLNNNNLLPNRQLRELSYINNGKFPNLVDWEVEFPTRLYSPGDAINFRISLNFYLGVIINFIQVELVQIIKLHPRNLQRSLYGENLIYNTQTIAHTNLNAPKDSSVDKFGFNLPIPVKSMLAQTMKTEWFEVEHKILIRLGIQNYCNSAKVCNLWVPVGIAGKSNERAVKFELPKYSNLSNNSRFLWGRRELPPIYSN